MSERPILFSTEMVQAILAGRKCQTRRVINRVKHIGMVTELGPSSSPPKFGYDWSARSVQSGLWHELSNKSLLERTPYQPGDVLWVREPWRFVGWNDDYQYQIQYKADRQIRDCEEPEGNFFQNQRYLEQTEEDCRRAGYEIDEFSFWVVPRDEEIKTRWRPSIFMPRWASRLSLTVIGVRIERLQDITLGGIAAEGWPDAPKEDTVWLPDLPEIQIAGFKWFIGVWDSIYTKRGFSFESNPFVKVISFKVNTGE